MVSNNLTILKFIEIFTGLEVSEIYENQFSVPCIRFMGNCRKPLFGSVNFEHDNLFVL